MPYRQERANAEGERGGLQWWKKLIVAGRDKFVMMASKKRNKSVLVGNDG